MLELEPVARAASGRAGGRPPPARGRRRTRIASIRTWSWKYSRCRRRSTAQNACVEIAGAQWAETSIECAFARPDAESRPVMPPQRVTSAWRQSTQPTRLAEVSRDVGVLAGRDLQPGRPRVADQRAARRGRPRRPAPRTRSRSTSGVALGPGERLLAREGAVRVDEELDVVADRLAGRIEARPGRARARARPSSSRAGSRPRPSRRAACTAAPRCTSRSRRCRRSGRPRAPRRAGRRAARRAAAPSDPRAPGRPRTRRRSRSPAGRSSGPARTSAATRRRTSIASSPSTPPASRDETTSAAAASQYV